MASTGVTQKPNFCRQSSSQHDTDKNFFHLRVIKVGRCRSLQERGCKHDSKHLEDRCHDCRAESALCTATGQQRDNTGGGGRTSSLLPSLRAGHGERLREGCAGHKVAQTVGAAVACCLYPQTTATPSL